MQIPSPRVRRRARIEIIPLIDIMFFLLATFMMVSLSMIQNKALPVRLPSASSSVPQEHKEDVTLTVTESGRYAWNKEPLGLPEIIGRLAQLKASNPDAKVFIHGDGEARFASVVALLDETRKAGVTRIAVETRSKNAE
ncbi:MAG: biopolymer transporter ExbD [Chthoniobacterales bacterium]